MKKRLLSLLLVVVMLTSIVVPAYAAELATLTYALDVNGESSVTVQTKDIVTVNYSITPSKSASFIMNQNQIVYDPEFLELQSCVVLNDSYTTSAQVESDGTHYIFFNTGTSKTTSKKIEVGTITFKVIGTSGSTTVENTHYQAQDNKLVYFDSAKQDLSISIKNDGNVVAVESVVLDSVETNLLVGTTKALKPTVNPANATNKNITWSSSDASVATVDANGVVTAKSEGTAVITAKTTDGGKTASCTVTVTKGDVFTVNASCGAGGTITPAGEQTVKKGEDIAFRFKANENYAIKDVKIDGVSNAAAIESGSYTFRSVEENHSIAVAFEKTGEAPVSNPFSDVKEGEYYYDAVLWATENGVTQGTSTTTFSPTTLVTRAQMVTFLWRAAGCPEPTGSAGKFNDVQRGSYYEKAVAWAIERGITKGTGATTFSPDTVCTRGQVVTLLARFAGVQDTVTQSAFSDVKSTDYFAAAVNWAKDNGVTSGTSATTFSPNADCTRGQIVTFLYRWMVR